ncbi:sugar phosphate isomerase/epimerase family protein [Verrucomicrobiota bacterium]
MKKCKDWPIGVCSWSLQMDVAGVAEAMKQLELNHIHLAVRPALEDGGKEYLEAVRKQDWTITSTMIDFPSEDYSSLDSIKKTGGVAPDECWEQNLDLALGAIDVTRELGVKYLSFHAGFIDHTDPSYAEKFYDRIRCLADAAEAKGVMLLMETGQESAEELRDFMEKMNHPALGINFDPANMILYNKDNPVNALKALSSWVKHVHIKDAVRTKKPGTWGAEVPWGDGETGGHLFIETLQEIGFNGALAIEREAGNTRAEDISTAIERLTV